MNKIREHIWSLKDSSGLTRMLKVLNNAFMYKLDLDSLIKASKLERKQVLYYISRQPFFHRFYDKNKVEMVKLVLMIPRDEMKLIKDSFLACKSKKSYMHTYFYNHGVDGNHHDYTMFTTQRGEYEDRKVSRVQFNEEKKIFKQWELYLC